MLQLELTSILLKDYTVSTTGVKGLGKGRRWSGGVTC